MESSPERKKLNLDNLIEESSVGGNVQGPFQEKKDVQEAVLISYTPDDWALLADKFSEEMLIADCPFGSIYHGKVPDKAQHVTILVLGNELDDTNEVNVYLEEMKFLSHSSIMSHPGFARPIEFCNGPPKCGFVFDLTSSSTLNDKLCDVRFTWSHRMMMALRLAQSLKYLHNFEPSFAIRTLDKTQIIIDKDCNSQLIAFGRRSIELFSKFSPIPLYRRRDGYIAPEIAMTGPEKLEFSYKQLQEFTMDFFKTRLAVEHSQKSSEARCVIMMDMMCQ